MNFNILLLLMAFTGVCLCLHTIAETLKNEKRTKKRRQKLILIFVILLSMLGQFLAILYFHFL